MKLTGAQILCESLLKEGVDVIFGFPGGVVLPLFDTFRIPNRLVRTKCTHFRRRWLYQGYE
jgi:thiamine pyrophosphate-dependent acetolactate synthase large subunit-like protein